MGRRDDSHAERIEELRRIVKRFERKGSEGTVFHEELAALEAAANPPARVRPAVSKVEKVAEESEENDES